VTRGIFPRAGCEPSRPCQRTCILIAACRGAVCLYAELSRMRVLSSPGVIESADQIVKKIISAYLDEPNKTFPDLLQMADSGLINPLRNFSEACRAEAAGLGYGPPGSRMLQPADPVHGNKAKFSHAAAPQGINNGIKTHI
jgi:hypothetical protein